MLKVSKENVRFNLPSEQVGQHFPSHFPVVTQQEDIQPVFFKKKWKSHWVNKEGVNKR